MKYKLTLIDKIYLFFENKYANQYAYLYCKLEKHYNNYYRNNNISFPFDYNRFLDISTKQLLFEYRLEE